MCRVNGLYRISQFTALAHGFNAGTGHPVIDFGRHRRIEVVIENAADYLDRLLPQIRQYLDAGVFGELCAGSPRTASDQ